MATTIEINVPDNLGEIQLRQYKKYLLDTKDMEEGDPMISQLMVQYLCNIDFENMAKISLSDLIEIENKLLKILNTEVPLKHRFKMGGIEFGLVPDLDKLSFGEFIDCDNYIKDWETMNKFMAVVFRPIKKDTFIQRFWLKKDKYELHPYTGSAVFGELMDMMPLDVAFGAVFFFKNLLKDLTLYTQVYLNKEMEHQISVLKDSLGKNGDGIPHFGL